METKLSVGFEPVKCGKVFMTIAAVISHPKLNTTILSRSAGVRQCRSVRSLTAIASQETSLADI